MEGWRTITPATQGLPVMMYSDFAERLDGGVYRGTVATFRTRAKRGLHNKGLNVNSLDRVHHAHQRQPASQEAQARE